MNEINKNNFNVILLSWDCNLPQGVRIVLLFKEAAALLRAVTVISYAETCRNFFSQFILSIYLDLSYRKHF